VVNFIARHGVSYSHMFSRLGRNVQFCSERYGRKVGDIMNANVSLSFIDLDSSSRINPEMHDRAKLVWEMTLTSSQRWLEVYDGFAVQSGRCSDVYWMVLYVLRLKWICFSVFFKCLMFICYVDDFIFFILVTVLHVSSICWIDFFSVFVNAVCCWMLLDVGFWVICFLFVLCVQSNNNNNNNNNIKTCFCVGGFLKSD